jgi:hypothetical protein
MKKLFLLFILLLIIFVDGVSQEKNTDTNNGILSLKDGNTNQNNAIIFDLFPMLPGPNGLKFGEGIGLGIIYERKMYQYFSLLSRVSFVTDFDEIFSYSFSPHFRIYPFKTTIGKFFADGGIAYRGRVTKTNAHQALSGVLSIGWKFILWNNFIIEPGFTLRLKIADISGEDPYKFGYGLLIGLGWVF